MLTKKSHCEACESLKYYAATCGECNEDHFILVGKQDAEDVIGAIYFMLVSFNFADHKNLRGDLRRIFKSLKNQTRGDEWRSQKDSQKKPSKTTKSTSSRTRKTSSSSAAKKKAPGSTDSRSSSSKG